VTGAPSRPSLQEDVLLIDVGNVLLHDTPVDVAFSYFVYQALRAEQATYQCTPLELLEQTRVRASLPPVHCAQLERAVAPAWAETLGRWGDLARPIRGALEGLGEMRGLRMAILANQPRETAAVLERYGASKLFEAVFLDSVVGLSKPDTAFFHHALTHLQATPEHTWMVGDRADNDLAPARSLGLRTVWIRPPPPDEAGPVFGVPEEWRQAYLNEVQHWHSAPVAPAPDLSFDSFAEFSRWAVRCGRHG
jgi:HAD superfamily hydrolase (TIGR01549 family)